MNLKSLIITLLFLASVKSYSFRLSGIITDEKNEPIPYATVYLKNTSNSVSSNIKGEFYMDLANGSYEIVFYSFGYEKKIVSVKIEGSSQSLNVQLNSVSLILNEVVISADKEDPAYEIIRNAIKAKDKYKSVTDAYSYNAYIKTSLTKEYLKKGPVDSLSSKKSKDELTKERMNFIESYSKVYHKSPNSVKEIKEAYKDLSEKNNNSFEISVNTNPDAARQVDVNTDLFKTKISEANFNFYENLINVPSLSQSPIISPLHYATFLSYKFHFEETFYEDGLWVNKISVIPRRTDASLVKGFIYIIDSLWCIKSVDFTVDPFTLNFYKSFRIIQKYDVTTYQKKCLLSEEEFYHDSKEGKKTNFGSTIIRYSNYNLNENYSPNFFNNELEVIVDEAYNRDTTYWEKTRPVKLKSDEQLFVNRLDSIDQYHKSERYLKKTDSITNKIKFQEVLFGMEFENSFKKHRLYIGGLVNNVLSTLIPLGNFRPMFSADYKKEFKKGYEIKPNGTIKYGVKNGDVRGDIGLSYKYLPKKFGRAYIEYKNDYGPVNSYQAISSALLMSNYINQVGYVAGHEIEIFNGLTADVNGELLQLRPLNLEYDRWFSSGSKTEEQKAELDKTKGAVFTPFDKFTLDMTLKFTPAQTYYTQPYKKIIVGSKYPTFALNYRKGIPNVLNSIADYDFLEFRAWDEMSLGSFGKSSWKVYSGKFFNSSSIQFSENKFFRKSDTWWFSNPLRSAQLLDTSISTVKEYFQTHYLHNFEGKILNKIPFIKKLRLTEVVGGSYIFINDKNFNHAELFAGIEKPFRLWKQRFKISGYFVVSDGNYSKTSGTFKVGLSVFNSFTNSWDY